MAHSRVVPSRLRLQSYDAFLIPPNIFAIFLQIISFCDSYGDIMVCNSGVSGAGNFDGLFALEEAQEAGGDSRRGKTAFYGGALCLSGEGRGDGFLE